MNQKNNLSIIGKITKNEGKLSYSYLPFLNLVKEINNNKLITDFNTNKLNLDINHSISIEPLYSYDGSVDLILTDDKNTPKLINSRFKVSENDSFEYVYRLGNKVENIYDQEHLTSEISLQKTSSNIVTIDLQGIYNTGDLPIGNYIFYFKYSDGDGNLSDIFAESGIISCFLGSDGIPSTINGGYRDLNSHKSIILNLNNLDTSYKSIKIYYSRESGDIQQNGVCEYKELVDEIPYNHSNIKIRISGLENTLTISELSLNLLYFNMNKAKTMVQILNRLFFGNIETPVDNSKELTDLSLRIVPILEKTKKDDLIGNVSTDSYIPKSQDKAEYYSSKNIYNHVGYWNEEIYRFGIVYIYNHGGLSSVYNVRGIKELTTNCLYQSFDIENNNIRQYIKYNDVTYQIYDTSYDENAGGVVRIVDNDHINYVYGIKFKIDNENNKQYIVDKLKELGIIGYFFVRQKRIPTILCQAVIGNVSKDGRNPIVSIPLLPNNKYESFIDKQGTLTNIYERRLKNASNNISNISKYAICPEYNLDLPHYNELFSGASLKTKILGTYYFKNSDRHYFSDDYFIKTDILKSTKILGIPDNTKTMAIDKIKFHGIAGTGEDAYRVGYIGKKTSWKFDKKWDILKDPKYIKEESNNVVRGIYGPRLALVGNNLLNGDLINIYIPDYDISKMNDYFEIRFQDKTQYYAIDQRKEIDSLKNDNNICYRGDCFICNYTWRVNRNFQDSSAPTNDVIVDEKTWRKYYNTDTTHIEELGNINRSDVNAVQLGSWITVKVCCSRNISLRAVDLSYPDEKSLTQHYRSFYPLTKINAGGDWKIPESFVLNDGFGKTVGHRWNNFIYKKYFNNDYSNRIIYSNIKESTSYTNAYRVFPTTNYKDYNMEKGTITKFVQINNDILCIFEHGIALIPILEKVQTSSDTSTSEIFINSKNVLPDRLSFISNSYGSQFADSIIKVDSGRVYGVDTVAKKIWMISGTEFKLISDLIIGEFLNDNIPLKEHDVSIILGLKNVKTHYNAAKGDVMFTFYNPNNISKFETAWNICYNDLLQNWITFYSWVPQMSANVNNVMYTFDRNYSRMISYLNSVKKESIFNKDDSLDTIIRKHINYYATNNKKIANNLCRMCYNVGLQEFDKNQIKIQYNNSIYKHGFGGIIDNQEKITPCKWYGRQHPFEFEFIVNDTPQAHKIFNNMRILSNKAKPESFHYEIIGECFAFAKDKKNMYYRQEAKKETFRNLGSNISYNSNYYLVEPIRNLKSTDTIWWYTRNDTDENLYDSYYTFPSDPVNRYDYRYLSGTEVTYYPKQNEFRLLEHAQAVDLKDGGRLRGNMTYLEDFWNVQINPIVITEKNEHWDQVPPLTLANGKIPTDLKNTEVTEDVIPDKYTMGDVDVNKWSNYKEIKLKDKWIKIRIRYSGEDLALISALYTMYSVSYA